MVGDGHAANLKFVTARKDIWRGWNGGGKLDLVDVRKHPCGGEDRMSMVLSGRESERIAHRFMCAACLMAVFLASGCASFGKNRLNSAETMILSTYPLASNKAFGTGFLVA